MTELGRQVIPGSQTPLATLLKKSAEQFMEEMGDDALAELHFTHHQKRRVKNLIRLNALIQSNRNGNDH